LLTVKAYSIEVLIGKLTEHNKASIKGDFSLLEVSKNIM